MPLISHFNKNKNEPIYPYELSKTMKNQDLVFRILRLIQEDTSHQSLNIVHHIIF